LAETRPTLESIIFAYTKLQVLKDKIKLLLAEVINNPVSVWWRLSNGGAKHRIPSPGQIFRGEHQLPWPALPIMAKTQPIRPVREQQIVASDWERVVFLFHFHPRSSASTSDKINTYSYFNLHRGSP
jgi:hypothetical protein